MRKKRRVLELALDNRPLGRNWRSKNAPAEDWQLKQLALLGCPSKNLKSIRFVVANQLIHKLKRERRQK
jgi:hypothetical protein